MNTEYIHTLLNKYWDCQTSTQEEKELHDFFSGDDVPEEFTPYIPLFTYINEQQAVTLSADFGQKLEAAMKEAGKKKYVTVHIFAPLLRVAASVLLIVGLGASLFFISKQNNKPDFAETTYSDPDAVFQQAADALEKLSYALQVSETASVQTIQRIDELDLDWSSLDSLSKAVSNNTETENTETTL